MWDFGGAGPRAQANLAPRFALEPAALVEYSNSSGAVIACRPQMWPAAHPSPGGQERRAGGAPTSISWRRLHQLPGARDWFARPQEQDQEEEEQLAAVGPLHLVRQDGSLVFVPFEAREFRPELHAATYRCCLANRFGSLCSRPVRTKAGEFEQGQDALQAAALS